MTISERVRKVRELRGFKQSAIADEMEITQQAYHIVEKGSHKSRLQTLQRFCKVCDVNLSFLLSEIQITEETLELYGRMDYSEVASEHRKLTERVKVLESLIK